MVKFKGKEPEDVASWMSSIKRDMEYSESPRLLQ